MTTPLARMELRELFVVPLAQQERKALVPVRTVLRVPQVRQWVRRP